jgi:hypothetical protein
MEEVKNRMLDFVHDTKNTDMPENKDFWDDVLLEVENATTEEELFRIGQEYFSIRSLDEIK